MTQLFNELNNLTQKKEFNIFLYIFLALLCIIPDILAVLYAPIYLDSGYYLSVVERIHDGLKPYSDIALGYTPLTFYIWYWLKSLFSIGISYEFYLTIHFIIQLICGYFVYRISLEIIQKKQLSIFAASLFLMASHWNEGNYVLLETPSLMWGLMALFIALHYSESITPFFIAGVLSSLSFLSKQYGFGFMLLINLLILFNKPNRVKQLLVTYAGFAIPVLICFHIWGFSFIYTVNQNYGYNTTFGVHIQKIMEGAGFFFERLFPVLVTGIFFVPLVLKNADRIMWRNILLLSAGIAGFLLQFYFWYSNHYFLYCIPFASILAFYLFDRIKRWRWIYNIFLILTCVYSFYCISYNRVLKVYINRQDIKIQQYQNAEAILKYTEYTKSLYLCGLELMPQYYLTNMCPPNLKDIGYSFGPALNMHSHLQQLEAADYIVTSESFQDFDYLRSKEHARFFEGRTGIQIDSIHTLYKGNQNKTAP